AAIRRCADCAGRYDPPSRWKGWSSKGPVKQCRTHLDDSQHVKGQGKERQSAGKGNRAAATNAIELFSRQHFFALGFEGLLGGHAKNPPRRPTKLSTSRPRKSTKR